MVNNKNNNYNSNNNFATHKIVKFNVGYVGLDNAPQTPEEVRSQCIHVGLKKHRFFFVGYFRKTVLITFILFILFGQVGSDELQLKRNMCPTLITSLTCSFEVCPNNV